MRVRSSFFSPGIGFLVALVLALIPTPVAIAADAVRPRVVLLIGEDEYHTWETLPEWAAKDLQPAGFEPRVFLADAQDKHRFPGFREAMREGADLLLVSVRRRALPKEDLDLVRAHVAQGRPVIGIRTASHAFAPAAAEAARGDQWPKFDPEVLGGNYQGHHGVGPDVRVTLAPGAGGHPLLAGISPDALRGKGSLYKVSPLMPGTTPLLLGTVPEHPTEPVAWSFFSGAKRAPVFYTSLGHPGDFAQPAFRRLLVNGVRWALAATGGRADTAPAASPSAVAPAVTPAKVAASSAWRSLVVPGTWEERGGTEFAGYDGFAWYRCLVRPPVEWRDRDWELRVEQVDNAHEAYLDGVRLGGAGGFPPTYTNAVAETRHYPVPPELRRAGDWVMVAIRVFDHDGRGGFKGQPPVLRAGDQVVALAGEWQFRTGDNLAWATRAEGESLGKHLFNDVASLESFQRGGGAEKAAAPALALSPAESAQRFTVAEGLEMQLVLSEPDIAQPLQISFDERGRLWLAEYRQYPSPAGLKLVSHDQFWRAVYDRVPAAPPNHVWGADRISIHEDTDGDGVYDRHTVFVDGLNIATAAVKGRGGVWVLNPPYLLFYPDRNNDDVPDGDPEVHLEGFGIEDTHSVVNSLRWGPDGWLYAAQGSTVSARVRRPGSTNAPAMTLGQNIWRYHPEQRRYEVFAEGGGNAFGVEMDDAGRIFSGHNGGNTRGFHYVQGGYLQKGFEKHGQLSNPYAFGYFPPMAHNDAERFTHTFVIYGGGAFSGQYDGKLFGIEPLQGRVVMSAVERVGSTFRTRDVGFAVTTTDRWFKPVDLKHGPDGALYVADWYDLQVNHWRNYQGNMDASNGRVYRLRPHGATVARPENLAALATDGLVERLTHPNRWVRQTALQLLWDRRDARAVEPLRRLLREQRGQSALEALWGLAASGGFTPELARETLGHANPQVREWTVRLLGDDGRLPDALLAPVLELARAETDADVRLQLAASARRWPAAAGLALVRALSGRDADAADPRQPLMVWWAVEAKAASDRAAVLALFEGPSFWAHALVREHLVSRLMRRYAQSGAEADFESCRWLLAHAPAAEDRRRLIQGFEEAFQGRSLAGLPKYLIHALGTAGGGSLALQLKTGRAEAVAPALALVADEKADAAKRAQVIQTLGELRLPAAVPSLVGAVSAANESVRLAALGALRSFEGADLAEQILGKLVALSGASRSAALSVLASRAVWARRLVREVDEGRLPAAEVPLDVARQMKRLKNPELVEVVTRLWPGTGRPTSADMERQIARLAAVVRGGTGDPYNGKKLFTANCAACHKLFNLGGFIGPDLTPYRRDDLDTVLLNIVNPSAEIREGYENFLVETRDERSLGGFIVRQDDQSVVLRGPDGQDVVLSRAEITELRPAGMSLMPEGLLDPLTDEQIRDFFAYLRSSQPLAN